MMEQGWLYGHMFGVRKIILISLIASLFAFPASYYLMNLPQTRQTTIVGRQNEIVFPCNSGSCYGIGAWNVTNGSPTLIETVSATYTCDCNADVNFIYSPMRTVYNSDGTISSSPTILSGGTLTVTADAHRLSGSGNVIVDIGVTP